MCSIFSWGLYTLWMRCFFLGSFIKWCDYSSHIPQYSASDYSNIICCKIHGFHLSAVRILQYCGSSRAPCTHDLCVLKENSLKKNQVAACQPDAVEAHIPFTNVGICYCCTQSSLYFISAVFENNARTTPVFLFINIVHLWWYELLMLRNVRGDLLYK